MIKNNTMEMENRRVNSSLITAVRKGKLEKVRKLINSLGLSHSKEWSQGYVLLCDALERGHAEVAKLLLTSGSTVNIKSEKPADTPLHLAVMNNNIEIVKMILNKGADVDAKNEHGKTPLHVAAERGHSQIAEHFLDNGANVNCVCTGGKNYTPLHFAVQGGSTEFITLLLSRGANVDAKGEDSITPLHIAAQKGYSDRCIRIVQVLLDHGACIHSSTLEEGYTPLHFASQLYNEETVKLLLDRGADIHARTKGDSTPLHIATKRGCGGVVKFLLQHGAKVDDQDKNGKTILLIAAEMANLTIVEDILKFCPDTNNQSNRSSLKISVMGHYGGQSEKICKALLEYGFTIEPEDANDPELLHAAVERGYLTIVEDLLKYGANVNALHDSSYRKGSTPLHSAAKTEQEEIAKLLISYGADVNARDEIGNTPILYAVEKADSKVTKLLLTNRADIKDNPELLNIAVDNKCIEIIEAILQYGADINATDEYGRTALHFTALNKCKDIFLCMKHRNINNEGEIAKLLLSKGVNVNAQTKDGVTTLHAAVEKGYAKVIEALLEYNANIDCKDKNDSTPLHISARKGNEDISIMLLDKGANVNAKQKDGMTPLHLAAQEGRGVIVKVLLKRGAKVDSKMENDMTPLHLAAKKGSLKIIGILLKLGTDIDARDEKGRTALHIASEHGHEDAVQFLLDYGSDINITCKNNKTALDYAMDGMSSFYDDLQDNDSDHYDYDDEFDECSHKYVAEALECHMIKMITADLYVSEQNSRLIGSFCRIDFSQDDCKKEIEKMKSQKIVNRRISFYDILTKDINSLAMYMRIKKIVEVSESKDYARDFPIYASMIKNNFRKGIQRRKLLARGSKSFSLLSNNSPELPYDCTLKIMSSLSDEDLRNLIDASKFLGISNSNTNDN